MRPFRLCCAVAAVFLTACPKPPAPPAADAGSPLSEPEVDAGTASVAPVAFTLHYALTDGGMDPLPLVGEEEGRPLIDATSVLELRSPFTPRNYRVRLFDEADRALVSDDTAEEAPGGLLYRITLPAPLKAGHRYTLVVDAQTGTSMSDAQGHELADLRASFQVAGEKEKPSPPPKKKRRR